MSKQHPSKAILWLARSLNEYAELEERNAPVPGARPAAPLYWFAGIYRESRSVFGPGGPGRDLLSPAAKRYADAYDAKVPS
jgi:hypothetical protein